MLSSDSSSSSISSSKSSILPSPNDNSRSSSSSKFFRVTSSVFLPNDENISTNSVGKNGLRSVAVNDSSSLASLEQIYKERSKLTFSFNSFINSSLYNVSSTTKRSYWLPCISSTELTDSSSSDVF